MAQNANDIAVAFEAVTVSYGSKPVLRDVYTRIPRGKLTSITGPNGAGKTTFLKTMLGLVEADAGTIHVFGEPVDAVRKRIAYVPQTETVDWDFPITVREVVMMGRYPHLGALRRPDKNDRARVADALDTVGMTEFAGRHIRQLSGGQQQRVFLARALAQEAEMLILDEPFTGIDARTEKALFELITSLAAGGRTVVVVNHNLGILDRFDHVLLLNKTVVSEGPPETAASRENVHRAYVGVLDLAEQAERTLREGEIDVRG